MFKYITLFSLILSNISYAQYDIKSIPDELKKNANTVIRNEETSITIKSYKEYTLNYKTTISILNKKGRDKSIIELSYNDGDKAAIKSAALYNEEGKLIKKMKQSDVMERTAVTRNFEAMEYTDGLLKVFSFNRSKYPYTIEYETEQTIKGTFFFPSWAPVSSYNTSCERASFKVTHPDNFDIRISHPGEWQPKKSFGDNRTSLTWVAKYVKTIDKPKLAPNKSQIFQTIKVAPKKFVLEGFKGDMSTWESLSSFVARLNKGRDILSNEEQEEIKKKAAEYETYRGKVKALYEYMQHKTRYVSIQLGIGGWQPFKASFVSKKGYGDCKALSNYMHSILKAVNISSHYALVYAGRNDEYNYNPDFPENRFNHAILCVPLRNDTIWLECTDQTLPAGYLSSFTANREALLIKEKGGQLVSTQKLGHKQNLIQRNIKVLVDSFGDYNLKMKTTYQGQQQETIFRWLTAMSNSRVKNRISKTIPLSSFTITKLEHTINKSELPSVEQRMNIVTKNPLEMTKERIFVPANLNFQNSSWYQDLDKKERDIPFQISKGFTDMDSIIITIPEGYQIEGVPSNKEFKSEFGSYSRKVIPTSSSSKEIVCIRKVICYRDSYPKDKYQKYYDFAKKVKKSDRQSFVFVKKS